MGGVSKLERYKNVVYLASSTSLMGIDLIKRREIHIHAFQSMVAGIHLYDPAEVSSNGKKVYRMPVRGMINNAKMICLTWEGLLFIFDIDSDGTRLKVHDKVQVIDSEQITFQTVAASSYYIAVSGRTNDSFRIVKVLQRLENKQLYTIRLRQGKYK